VVAIIIIEVFPAIVVKVKKGNLVLKFSNFIANSNGISGGKNRVLEFFVKGGNFF